MQTAPNAGQVLAGRDELGLRAVASTRADLPAQQEVVGQPDVMHGNTVRTTNSAVCDDGIQRSAELMCRPGRM